MILATSENVLYAGRFIATRLGYMIGLELVYNLTNAHWRRFGTSPYTFGFTFGHPTERVLVAIFLKSRHGNRCGLPLSNLLRGVFFLLIFAVTALRNKSFLLAR